MPTSPAADRAELEPVFAYIDQHADAFLGSCPGTWGLLGRRLQRDCLRLGYLLQQSRGR